MNEDLRHSPENIKRLSDQKEFGSGDVYRNYRRAVKRQEESKGLKPKFLGKKKLFSPCGPC